MPPEHPITCCPHLRCTVTVHRWPSLHHPLPHCQNSPLRRSLQQPSTEAQKQATLSNTDKGGNAQTDFHWAAAPFRTYPELPIPKGGDVHCLCRHCSASCRRCSASCRALSRLTRLTTPLSQLAPLTAPLSQLPHQPLATQPGSTPTATSTPTTTPPAGTHRDG